MTEFELIDLFTRRAPDVGEGVQLGIGDDAAVLRPPPGEDLVATVDSVVEGVHFDGTFPARDVGWKSLAVNLSDLAAMGARPLWALCALGARHDARPAYLAGIGDGLAACAREYGIALVGGNVTRAQDISVTVTVVGAAARGRAITRSGARPGDALLVSGTLGDAALGIAAAVRRRGGARQDRALLRRQRRPVPRLALGRALAGLATAAIDISDGLLQDLGHICDASGIGAEVRLEALPLSRAYRAWAAGRPRPFDPALTGGEDYELLVAVPPRRVERARVEARRVGLPLTLVGACTRARGVRALGEDGRPYRPLTSGHDHLR